MIEQYNYQKEFELVNNKITRQLYILCFFLLLHFVSFFIPSLPYFPTFLIKIIGVECFSIYIIIILPFLVSLIMLWTGIIIVSMEKSRLPLSQLRYIKIFYAIFLFVCFLLIIFIPVEKLIRTIKEWKFDKKSNILFLMFGVYFTYIFYIVRISIKLFQVKKRIRQQNVTN